MEAAKFPFAWIGRPLLVEPVLPFDYSNRYDQYHSAKKAISSANEENWKSL